LFNSADTPIAKSAYTANRVSRIEVVEKNDMKGNERIVAAKECQSVSIVIEQEPA
jgi:hypothetical protein